MQSERAVLHTVSQSVGGQGAAGLSVPLLGDDAHEGLTMVPHSALHAVTTAANRQGSSQHPALVVKFDGAAVWTEPQVTREVIAGSWGVVPAKLAHLWSLV